MNLLMKQTIQIANISIFFFWIGNKDLYSRTPPYAERHEAESKIQRVRKECKRERKERKLST